MPAQNLRLLIWVDAQLPPVLSRWIADSEVQSIHVSEIGLLSAEDPEIFEKARSSGAIVMTKDEDFVHLQEQRGTPPQLVWLTCGNISNSDLKTLILSRWEQVVLLLRAGEPLIEINGGRSSG